MQVVQGTHRFLFQCEQSEISWPLAAPGPPSWLSICWPLLSPRAVSVG